jgi:hypothetical protein
MATPPGAGRVTSAIHRIIENPVYGGAYAYGKTAVAAGYSAEREREDPPQGAERMAGAEAQHPRRVCELGEVRGNPRHGQQQRSHQSASRRAQAWRRAAGRSDPVQALRLQAHIVARRRRFRRLADRPPHI